MGSYVLIHCWELFKVMISQFLKATSRLLFITDGRQGSSHLSTLNLSRNIFRCPLSDSVTRAVSLISAGPSRETAGVESPQHRRRPSWPTAGASTQCHLWEARYVQR